MKKIEIQRNAKNLFLNKSIIKLVLTTIKQQQQQKDCLWRTMLQLYPCDSLDLHNYSFKTSLYFKLKVKQIII